MQLSKALRGGDGIMKSNDDLGDRRKKTISIEKPIFQDSCDRKLWEEVQKYVRLIPEAPDPNMGRVREIKDEIKNGTYLNSQMIEEAAARLAMRFMKIL